MMMIKKKKAAGRVVMEDISNGTEKHPIPVINDINNELPREFNYILKNALSHDTKRSMKMKVQEKNVCNCQKDAYGRFDCGKNCPCHQKSSVNFNVEKRVLLNPQKISFYTDFYVECSYECECQGKCNRQILPGIQVLKKLKIVYTDHKGFGVFAAQPIATGMPIAEYTGEVFSKPTELRDYNHSDYQQDLLNIDEETHFVVDAHRSGNVTRFINHSCFGNVVQLLVYRSLPLDDRSFPLPRVILIASRDILPDQELNFDYRPSYFRSRRIFCRCYEPVCLIPPHDWVRYTKSVHELEQEIRENKTLMYSLFRSASDIENEEIVLD